MMIWRQRLRFAFLMTAAATQAAASPFDGVPWRPMGHANNVTAMAASNGQLYATTTDDRLWVRDPVPTDVAWRHIGHANDVVGMASAGGKLFAATSDDRFWVRDPVDHDVPWRHIGSAHHVTAMTSLDGELYAATSGNLLWRRRAVDRDVDWRRAGTADDVVGLSAAHGKLFALDRAGRLHMRDPEPRDSPWRLLGSSRSGAVAMAAINGILFAATRDHQLYWLESGIWPRRPEDFGYGRIAEGTGHLPLLIILMQFCDVTFGTGDAVERFDELVFGDFPNLSSYFRESSHGRFSVHKAMIAGPYVKWRSGPDGCTVAEARKDPHTRQALQRAATDFAFSSYDRDRDGRVDSDELLVLIINSDSTAGGQTSNAPRFTVTDSLGRRVRLRLRPSRVGRGVGFATVVHELGHQAFDLDHIYGSRSNSRYLSPMSSTHDEVVQMDPWHKIQLGWVRPRIYRIDERGFAVLLAPHASSSEGRGPLILYDPRRGRRRYFVLEYRTAHNPGRQHSDRDVKAKIGTPPATRGVVAWYVETNGAGELEHVKGLIRSGDDGVLNSRRRRDDVVAGNEILPGLNGVIDSDRRGDDKLSTDVLDFSIGLPETPEELAVGGKRGQGNPFRVLDTSAEENTLRWFGDNAFAARIAVVFEVTETSGSAVVRW